MGRAIKSVEFYPVTPRTEDDDPHEIDTPVVVNFRHGFADRIYEELLDDYMSLTEEEFQQMRKALNKAHKRRKAG